MEPQASPLSTEDYQALMAMSRSDDPELRGRAAKLSQKLTPEEQQAFFDVQKQGNAGAERNRVDNSIFGMPPEMALASGLPIGRAMASGGLSMAGRAAAGGKEFATQAMPAVKYELAKTALTAAGVPGPVATIMAMGFSGYSPRHGTSRKAATSEAAPAEAAAAEAAVPPRELTKQVSAAHRAKSGLPAEGFPATAGPATPAMAEAKPALSEATRLRMKLTPEEAEVYQGLWAQGITHDKAIAAVRAMRSNPAQELSALKGLPTDAEVSRRVSSRNATGKWDD